MQYSFFNKNRELFQFNYNEQKKIIDDILILENRKYFPLTISNFKDNDNLINKFNIWLNMRYSKNSSWYKRMKLKYGGSLIDEEFAIKSYGLSLSDQYWLKPSYAKETWSDVNFFHNEFNYQPFLKNNMERTYNYKDVDVLYSPNLTTGGELDKAWAIVDGKRILYKSSNTFLGLEPINEYVASKICEIIGLEYARYKIEILSNLENKIMVSACPTFIDEDTELILASAIILPNKNYQDAYLEYIDFLNSNGIKDAQDKIKKMILLDIIMTNHDRHLNNFGVIRNVNTLEYIDVAPIYDTGRAMMTEFLPNQKSELGYSLFTSSSATKEECLEFIKTLELTSEQVSRLREISKLYEDVLNEYYDYTNLKLFKDDIKTYLINLLVDNINLVIENIKIV